MKALAQSEDSSRVRGAIPNSGDSAPNAGDGGLDPILNKFAVNAVDRCGREFQAELQVFT